MDSQRNIKSDLVLLALLLLILLAIAIGLGGRKLIQ